MPDASNYEIIANYTCSTGEGPLWHPDEKQLYWTDIPAGRLFVYNPVTNTHQQVYDDRPVGGFTIQADGNLLLFRDRGNVVTWRNGQVLSTVIDEVPDDVDTRFNDVYADFEGRVYCGTMSCKARKGRLYRLDTDGSLTLMLENIGCSNGMGFTPDGQRLYYTDSSARHIYRFDYDRATGNLTNQITFITTPEGEGAPDGMTVDAEGCIWSARWDGSGLYRYSPTGEFLQEVKLPAKKITSIIFAGDDLRSAYVTSATPDKSPDDGEHAGALFRLDLGVAGLPEHRSRIGL